MKVISTPSRLRVATAMILFSVPLVAFETIVATRSPWWRLPYQAIRLWSVAALLLCIPLAFWMNQGRRWALYLASGMGTAWCLLTAWFSLRSRNPSLAFFCVLLGAYWLGLFVWIRHEMTRSFFDPGLRWFQGLPRPIPGLECEIESGKKLRVSRIDADGAFLFSDEPIPSLSGIVSEVGLSFLFKDRRVACKGTPVRTLDGERGAGYQFRSLSPDARKDLNDFVETLRGEGHVQ